MRLRHLADLSVLPLLLFNYVNYNRAGSRIGIRRNREPALSRHIIFSLRRNTAHLSQAFFSIFSPSLSGHLPRSMIA